MSSKGILEALDLRFKNELPARDDVVLTVSDINRKVQMKAKVNNV